MTIFDLIVFVIIFGAVAYFAYRSGFEEGQSAANRRHTQQLSRLKSENETLRNRTVDLYNWINEIEKRLSRAEFKLKHTLNMLHGRVVVKGTMPDGAADCELKYDHDPSGQMVGSVVETENTEDDVRAKIKMAEDDVRAKIKMADEYLASDVDLSDIVDNAVKSQWETIKAMND